MGDHTADPDAPNRTCGSARAHAAVALSRLETSPDVEATLERMLGARGWQAYDRSRSAHAEAGPRAREAALLDKKQARAQAVRERDAQRRARKTKSKSWLARRRSWS